VRSPCIEAAGGKTAFAALIGVTERYVDMLLSGERQMSKRLDNLIRLKIAALSRSKAITPTFPQDAGNR
jgi:hypothetical protein